MFIDFSRKDQEKGFSNTFLIFHTLTRSTLQNTPSNLRSVEGVENELRELTEKTIRYESSKNIV